LNRVIEDTSTKLKMNWQPAIEETNGERKFLGFTLAVWVRLLAGAGDDFKRKIPIDLNLNLLAPLAEELVRKIDLKNADAFTFAVFGPMNNRKLINDEIMASLRQMEFSGIRGTLDLYNKIYT